MHKEIHQNKTDPDEKKWIFNLTQIENLPNDREMKTTAKTSLRPQPIFGRKKKTMKETDRNLSISASPIIGDED